MHSTEADRLSCEVQASIDKGRHVGQPAFSELFALLSLAGASPPASKRTKIPRKSKAVRCEAVLRKQKCPQTMKSPQRILCVFSRALRKYEGISAPPNRVCPCQSTRLPNYNRDMRKKQAPLRRDENEDCKPPPVVIIFIIYTRTFYPTKGRQL